MFTLILLVMLRIMMKEREVKRRSTLKFKTRTGRVGLSLKHRPLLFAITKQAVTWPAVEIMKMP